MTDPTGGTCSIARTITALGDRWSLLVLREAAFGTTRFSEFRRGSASRATCSPTACTPSSRTGVLERVEYQEEGSRTRTEYRLTDAGRDFQVVLGALGGWGREHLPQRRGPRRPVARHRGRPVRVAFVDADGRVLADDEVTVHRA